MKTSDRVIADLMGAMAAIEVVARRADPGALHVVLGMAEQAQANANAYRVRNTDGYLVLKEKE